MHYFWWCPLFEVWWSLRDFSVSYPVGTLTKPGIQMRAFLILDFFQCFCVREKIKTCWIYNNVFANWEKYKLSWNVYVLLIIDFQSCIPGSFDTVTSLHMGFHRERAVAGLEPSGLTLNREVNLTTSTNRSQLHWVSCIYVPWPARNCIKNDLLQFLWQYLYLHTATQSRHTLILQTCNIFVQVKYCLDQSSLCPIVIPSIKHSRQAFFH